MVFSRGDLDFDYPDEGCHLAKSCLQCPFERCLEEEPGSSRQHHRAIRDARIWAHSRTGKGSLQIAAELGVSQRTIQRSLARERKPVYGGKTGERGDSLALEGERTTAASPAISGRIFPSPLKGEG